MDEKSASSVDEKVTKKCQQKIIEFTPLRRLVKTT